MARERLQKIMAAAGIDSRRNCEELIIEGAVRVNGHVVDELPAFADPDTDNITVNGKPLRKTERLYYLLNKPKNVICTNYDPQGRSRAIDVVGPTKSRVFCVGRLEADSTGLLIITNDSELTNKLTHPSFGLEKKYIARVKGKVDPKAVEMLKKGVWLSEGRTAAKDVRIIKSDSTDSILEITLVTGPNRSISRMLAKLGYKVKSLARTQIGKLSVKGLALGQWRKMTTAELDYIRKLSTQKR